MTKRLTTRSIATAQAVRDAVPFITSGSLKASAYTPEHRAPFLDAPSKWVDHALDMVEWEMYNDDRSLPGIDYIVWSYSTPIAWRRADGKWRIVAQSFSITTTKHQGNLYLIDRGTPHEVTTVQTGAKGERHRVRCETCGTTPTGFRYINEARRFAHGHRFNHDHPRFAI